MSSHISEFNNHIQSYFISSTYGNETLVNNSLKRLALVTDQRVFDVSVYGNNVFFINLHKLMSVGTKKMALMWTSVSVLEAASRCEETRKALVTSFHYLPTLADMLQEIHNNEQQQRLLALMELLTHGAQLESFEPYVEMLILKLLGVMEQGHGQKDKSELIILALSILVNLCYRNLPMTYLLTKNISISRFCGQIKQFGLVACKMYIILERNDYMKEMDFHYLLKMSFKEVRNVLATKNSFILRHVVDYLHYIRQLNRDEAPKENGKTATSIQDNFFRDNLKEFLEDIETHSKGQTRARRRGSGEQEDNGDTDSSDDCMDVLFEILECIVALEPVGESFRRRIGEVALNWFRGKRSCSRAVTLLQVILERSVAESTGIDEIIKAIRGALNKDMASALNKTDEKLMISISKLLTTIVRVQKASGSDLDQFAEEFFQNTLIPTLDSPKGCEAFNYSLPDSEIRIFLWAFHALVEIAHVSNIKWYSKVDNLHKQKAVYFMVAKGLTSGDMELTEAMMHLVASENFPRRDVSKMVGMLSSNKRGISSESQQQTRTNGGSAVLPAPSVPFSRDLLERMNQTVSHIQDASSAGQINDVTKVELIEFYNCKIRIETQLMNDLRSTLRGMSTQIHTLMHQNQLLSAEVDKVQRRNLPLELKVSALETENRSLETELNQMKNATASYDKKISQMKQELSEYIKKYNSKNQMCVALTKEVEMYRVRDGNYEKENKRLQLELTDMTKTRDDSRRLLKAADEDRQKLAEQKESDRKMFESKIREREREISKRNDLVQQLEQQLSKRDSKIESQEGELKELLGQIAEKDARIAQIEADLKESEQIQKAIYSLMNKGKK